VVEPERHAEHVDGQRAEHVAGQQQREQNDALDDCRAWGGTNGVRAVVLRAGQRRPGYSPPLAYEENSFRKPRTAPAEGVEHVEHAPQVARLRQVAPEGGDSSICPTGRKGERQQRSLFGTSTLRSS